RGTGIDTSFQFLPYFVLAADEQERDELRAGIPWLRSEGYPAEWLDGDALRRLEPRFAADLVGVLRVEGAALVGGYGCALAPALLDAEIVQQTACLRPFSPDGLPIVDAAPGLSGLWLATGGGRRGILLSSVMGKATADLIVKGQAEVDLTPYSLGRFG